MNPALRSEILAILDGANDMTPATIRPDGYPQATTVSYTHDGLTLYFGCGASRRRPGTRWAMTESRRRSIYSMRIGARSAPCRWAAGRHRSTTRARSSTRRGSWRGISPKGSLSMHMTGCWALPSSASRRR